MHVYALVSVVPTTLLSRTPFQDSAVQFKQPPVSLLSTSPGGQRTGHASVCEAFPVLRGRQMYAHKSPGFPTKPLPSRMSFRGLWTLGGLDFHDPASPSR